MNAYDRLYLEDARHNLGEMLDYAVNVKGMELKLFYDLFLASSVSRNFANGNPRYLCGLSGRELYCRVMEQCQMDAVPADKGSLSCSTSAEYWTGWALAYLQWQLACGFGHIACYGPDIEQMYAMYSPLHEAPESKFVDVCKSIMDRNIAQSATKLRIFRKNSGMSQEELAQHSGVSLRMIRAYEQKQQDIRKASADTLLALSRVLNVTIESLVS